jgi:hypothetical protein
MASGSTKPLHHRCGTGLYINLPKTYVGKPKELLVIETGIGTTN